VKKATVIVGIALALGILLSLLIPAPKPSIQLATTTSLDNSGLLKALLPAFEQRHGVAVHVIATGTGKALKLGENGDVDVLLVHAPPAERAFIDNGCGIGRTTFMKNDFVIIGPKDDPAGISGETDAVKALTKISAAATTFVSRGDDSGTHKKEKTLWEAAGLTPAGPWYLETGQGMGATLKIADEKKACTLTDRGTFLAFEDKIELVVRSAGDPRLENL